MFCPFINGECPGNSCVKWVHDRDACYDQVAAQKATRVYQMVDQTASMMKLVDISWALELRRLMQDPTIPPEIKEELAKARDAEVVEHLLKDAGLL